MVNPRLINLAEKLGNEVLPRQEALNTEPEQVSPPRVSNMKDYIVLENIVCRDSNGKPFEQYPQLSIKKDIERDDNQNHINHNPYEWIPYFEDKGLFLPSFALSCNILAALYAKRSDPAIEKVLMQYKDYGPGYGWHAQNTIIDWGANRIIHYPTKNTNGDSVNAGRETKEFPFTRKGIRDVALEEALRNKDFKAYVQNLTGLTKPETLIDIGNYFGKTAHIWTSSGKDKRAAWLGCINYDYFDLNTINSLSYDLAARGVRAKKMSGATRT
jgi:hypothetical protein